MKKKIIPVVKVGPAFEFPRTGGMLRICYGIMTEQQARAWGEREGFKKVYWWERRGRAYAIPEKSLEDQDELAE